MTFFRMVHGIILGDMEIVVEVVARICRTTAKCFSIGDQCIGKSYKRIHATKMQKRYECKSV